MSVRSGWTAAALALLLPSLLRADLAETFDRWEDALTFSSSDAQFRARVSALADAEAYDYQSPAPGFIRAGSDELFNPRLTVYVDGQAGDHVYLFTQTRIDRGFDPADAHVRARLDEYALRWRPGTGRSFSLQVGKFATVVGNWTPRHDSWTDPFITAPLAYDSLTGIWDAFPARSAGQLLAWAHVRPFPPADADAGKQLRLPLIWGPSYATGAAVAGAIGAFTYAAEVKDAPLASRPSYWSATAEPWSDPTVAVRLGFQPSPTWNVGLSASEGVYLDHDAAALIPAGYRWSNYHQIVIGQDAAYAYHHLQAWAEIYAVRFEVPTVGNADTVSYYAEAKYTFAPAWFAGVRWNQQLYGRIPFAGGLTPWGGDVWRTDLSVGHRFSSHLQGKFQYSAQQGGGVSRRNLGHTLAAQLTLRL